jgi:predicted MFS family arabinose efflux permease
MLETGLAFSQVRGFWPLAVVGFVGTLNPSGGDVSPFLPLEQSLIARAVAHERRTSIFARYSLVGAVAAAAGALSLRLVPPLARSLGLTSLDAMRALFVVYGLLALVALAFYARLPSERAQPASEAGPLRASRTAILKLSALFSLDSFGGGFIVQAMLALWLFRRFGLSLQTAADFFFWAGLLTAGSMLAAGPLARRFGLINTMVFTHLPANACVVAAAFAPKLWMVMALLLIRAALSSLDVPARTAFVMAVVTPQERAAAAGVTNVPRSLAAAISPTLAGWLLNLGPVAWPLLIGGSLKIVYDLSLLALFRSAPESVRAEGAPP